MKPQLLNPEHSVILEGDYPTSIVDLHRFTLDRKVANALTKLNLRLKNTAQEKEGYPYIGDIQWEQALRLNLALNCHSLTQLQFFDLRRLLLAGIEGGTKVHNGKGSKIQPDILKVAYDEIFDIRDPWRGELLDAHYELASGVLRQNHTHTLLDEKFVPQHSDLIIGYIQERCFINPTHYDNQGLPTRKSRKKEFYYFPPCDNSVARFRADSGRAGLDCGRDPQSSYSSLGVRAAKLYAKKHI